jgi:ParB-like chromosome segregation protein Spo0J
METHKFAKFFPLLEGEEFDQLVESIKTNGQREPIVLYAGQILDGVNRYNACQELGIEPKVRNLKKNEDPLDYVIDMNVRRRHLNVSQRAMLGENLRPEIKRRVDEEGKEKVAEDLQVERPETRNPTDELIGKVVGTSREAQKRAKRVKEQAPEKVDDIIKGKTTVSAVDEELRKAKAKKEEEEFNAEHPPADPFIAELELKTEQYMTDLSIAFLNIKKVPKRTTEMGLIRIISYWTQIKDYLQEKIDEAHDQADEETSVKLLGE